MPMKNPPGAAATLGVDPEISRSQDSRSMLAILPSGGKGAAGGGRGRTRNGQALRRDGFGFEGWHNVEGGGGRIGGWLSN